MGDMVVRPAMMEEWKEQQRNQEIREEATRQWSGQELDNKCYQKAIARGQRTFTLVEQDPTAVETIAFWIMKNIHTAPPEKLRKALQDCIDMREYLVTHITRAAD